MKEVNKISINKRWEYELICSWNKEVLNDYGSAGYEPCIFTPGGMLILKRPVSLDIVDEQVGEANANG